MTSFEADVSNLVLPLVGKDFHVQEATDSSVRLASEKVDLEIGYDRHRSFEVSVDFAFHDAPTTFSLLEVFREFDVPKSICPDFFQSENYSDVIAHLVRVFQTIRQYANDVLIGSPSVYRRLAERQTKEAAEYTMRFTTKRKP